MTLPISAARFGPLQPRFWRYSEYFSPSSQFYSWTALTQAFLALAPGARLNMLLAQDWGFPLGNWNGTHRPPWEDWLAYEAHVRNLARTLKAAGLNGTFEVWNEPDSRTSGTARATSSTSCTRGPTDPARRARGPTRRLPGRALGLQSRGDAGISRVLPRARLRGQRHDLPRG